MILVIDTNVFASVLIFSEGHPGRILDYFLDGRFLLALDDRIYLEYGTVIKREKFGFDKKGIATLLKFIKDTALFVTPEKLDIKLPDPSDLKFVEVAKTAEADALITENTKHFEIVRGTIRILTPKDAWEKLF